MRVVVGKNGSNRIGPNRTGLGNTPWIETNLAFLCASLSLSFAAAASASASASAAASASASASASLSAPSTHRRSILALPLAGIGRFGPASASACAFDSHRDDPCLVLSLLGSASSSLPLPRLLPPPPPHRRAVVDRPAVMHRAPSAMAKSTLPEFPKSRIKVRGGQEGR